MILTDEAAFILVGLIIVAGIVVLCVAAFGLYLARRGYRVVGFGIVLALVGALMGPGILDRVSNVSVRADLDARQMIPDTLDLRGQRVLFIETGGTICGEMCRDVVGIGTQTQAHWVGIGTNIPSTFTDRPLRDVMDPPEMVQQMSLGAASQDVGAQRFAEVTATGYTPPYDVIVLVDNSGLLDFIAPDLLGPTLPGGVSVQQSVLVFSDWADPFASPPPTPTYRSAVGYVMQRPLLPIPLMTRGINVPNHVSVSEAWARAVCPFAGPPDTRDDFTYGFVCRPQ